MYLTMYDSVKHGSLQALVGLQVFYVILLISVLMLKKQFLERSSDVPQTSTQKHTSSTAVLSKLMVTNCAEYCPTNIGQLPSPIDLVGTIREENELSQSSGSR